MVVALNPIGRTHRDTPTLLLVMIQRCGSLPQVLHRRRSQRATVGHITFFLQRRCWCIVGVLIILGPIWALPGGTFTHLLLLLP